jgi:predicted ribosome quality control (RQC) complex YloA/Tae2 family protein
MLTYSGVFMLSMCELRRVVSILHAYLPGSALKRIVLENVYTLILAFVDSNKNKTGILLSCDPEFARICKVKEPPATGSSTASFYEYIRAHLQGAVVSGIDIANENRQVRLDLNSQSDFWHLYLSILGSRSNIYLVDARERLIHCMRSLEETRRDLKLGEPWSDPPGSVPLIGSDRWIEIPDEVYLEAVCGAYDRLELEREAQFLARRISQALNKEKAVLNRKLTHLHEDLDRARLAETYRQKGELLKSVLHAIKPGDTCVTATDYRTGKKISIEIDPTISPERNLKEYFARYRKNSKGEKMIRHQLQRLQMSRDEIEKIEIRIESALHDVPPDVNALEEISAQQFVRRLISRYVPKQKGKTVPAKSKAKNEVPSRLRPKRYRTEDDLEIWVGKNDEGNDYLTTRLARGNDLFFHLEGYPGSHVILRTEGRTDPPAGSVLDACELAVHFSKMKNAGSADVHITPIKNVKKPKGAKPGLVYVRQGKTVHLRRDPARLQNILASRCDD